MLVSASLPCATALPLFSTRSGPRPCARPRRWIPVRALAPRVARASPDSVTWAPGSSPARPVTTAQRWLRGGPASGGSRGLRSGHDGHPSRTVVGPADTSRPDAEARPRPGRPHPPGRGGLRRRHPRVTAYLQEMACTRSMLRQPRGYRLQRNGFRRRPFSCSRCRRPPCRPFRWQCSGPWPEPRAAARDGRPRDLPPCVRDQRSRGGSSRSTGVECPLRPWPAVGERRVGHMGHGGTVEGVVKAGVHLGEGTEGFGG